MKTVSFYNIKDRPEKGINRGVRKFIEKKKIRITKRCLIGPYIINEIKINQENN